MKLSSLLVVGSVIACGSAASAQTQMPLPDYARTFSGSVRGYYFTAPVDFRIVAVSVPDETGAGVQSVEVVRFNNNTPPPAFASTTNDFVSLARFVDEPAGNRLPVDILVRAGEVIGLYGQCSGANSYGPAGAFMSDILGRPTELFRSGMQFPLNSGPMHDIWAEVTGAVSRVEMYYEEVGGQPCYADCDQSTGAGVLDIFDFLCFQNAFVGADPYACECDTSTGLGVCDIFDFLCFQDAFVAGCP